ncbi:16S rRNA (guanine(966)-N(2))-methyltransferase RsmD [Leifsonia bigeumensis]|uniref:16S rRNA (Guanine(966)-N(2))-methyltransferase RsmD n=1 Tax=Leifsonella bigeumensis TaxID=433643 RepID=A0ABP7FZ91_9MICO
MTRIIAGFAGSLALAVPGAGTRPTSDRVREAIFSALESRDAIRDARVLDLYAGSGALGLEAASRGAASVTLVERNAAAARVCRENAERVRRNAPKTGVPDNIAPEIVVVHQAVQAFLDAGLAAGGGPNAGPWDLVFLDPPYELGDDELLAGLRTLVPLLAPDAVVLLERGARSRELAWPPPLQLDRSRSYGDTTLWWLGLSEDDSPR